ncbi:GIY-YIG nuclease family protein [Streptomyces sp. NPDC051662]|uniref:GIY-YIG nuclease family protein n=1 Tax=Streptomyces sp. NPDC051662 TaxID=3154750 RepID=UPI00341F35F6
MSGIGVTALVGDASHKPLVYFAQLGDFVKIGTTTNLKRRMSTLALHVEWVVLVMPGDKEVEAEFHARFAPQRLAPNREWFRLAGELRRFLSPSLEARPVRPRWRLLGGRRLVQKLSRLPLGESPGGGDAASAPPHLCGSADSDRPPPPSTPTSAANDELRSDLQVAGPTEHPPKLPPPGGPGSGAIARRPAAARAERRPELPIPAPNGLSLAEIARRLSTEGLDVSNDLLRQHKRRHASFPRPTDSVGGRDYYAYEEVRDHYTARSRRA